MKTAVLLMAYGSPTTMDDLRAYLQGIYEGKPVPDYALRENMEKYRMVNAISPSNAIIDSVISKLKGKFNDRTIGVFLGNKHWKPWISDVVKHISEEGFRKIIAIPMFPFPSHNIVESYSNPLMSIIDKVAPQSEISIVNGLDKTDEFFSMWANIVSRIPFYSDKQSQVVYTAHSLPNSRDDESMYDKSFTGAARKISEIAGVDNYLTAYQSRGKHGNSWLEPSVYDVLAQVDRTRKRIITVPIGFLYTHLEVLYDLDREFGNSVKNEGFEYVRSGLPDSSDEYVDLLYGIIQREIKSTTY